MCRFRKVKSIIVAILGMSLGVLSYAQNTDYEKIQVSEKLQNVLNDSIVKKIVNQLDILFFQIANDHIDSEIILIEHADLTLSILEGLNGVENEQIDSIKNYYKKQLIKFYLIDNNTYSLSIAFISNGDKKTIPVLKTIFNIIAEYKNGIIKFSLPLTYLTKNWKSAKVGDITYMYKDEIQIDRARIFNDKNVTISKKLNVKKEQFKFYMCKNYQEILSLLGYEYQLESATRYRDGYGVEEGFIFSIMNNEDFSHDVFHYYSGKIHDNNQRNWIAEEGIACSWGNAYYTDKNGEMITLKRLVIALKAYLLNTNVDVLYLFENDIKIFNHIASELSVRSVISGLICEKIENQLGIDGVISMINCGKTPNAMEAYFTNLNKLMKIDKHNFNIGIRQYLTDY